MAPGRKRGAKGVKTTSDLNLGDLVLAKVKGFPAWPAKISRPEDWNRPPDPKKYFVQFFGTEEIAFVAPADIQAFTIEAKNKVSAKCQGKTVKYFAQAVKEICAEFEKLQRDVNCLIDDTVKSPMDRATDDSAELELENTTCSSGANEDADIKGHGNHVPGLERCSQRHNSIDSEDMKPIVSSKSNVSLSPVLSSRKRNKPCIDGPNLVKRESDRHHFRRAEIFSDIKDENNVTTPSHNQKDCSVDAGQKHSDGARKELSNGTRSKKMASGLKKESESRSLRSGSLTAHTSLVNDGSDGHCDPLGSGNNSKNIRPSSLGDGKKGSCQSHLKVDDAVHGKKMKKPAKDKNHLEVASNLRTKADDNSNTHRSDEVSRRGKVQDGNITKPVAQSKTKSDSHNPNINDRRVDNAEIKSSSHSKVENRVALKLGYGSSVVLDDEGVLPPTKRHRRALEAMYASSATNDENKVGRGSVSKKDSLCSDYVKSPGTQSQSRRRAVRMYDDDDDDEPKTPVHGAPSKKFCAAHNLDSVNDSNIHYGSANHEQSGEDLCKLDDGPSKDAASLTKISGESKISENVEKKTSKGISTQASNGLGKMEQEKVSSKTGKPVLVSPKMSPKPVTSNKALTDAHEVTESSAKFCVSISQKKNKTGSNKGMGPVSDVLVDNHNQVIDENDKPSVLPERPKSTPKSNSRMSDSTCVPGSPLEQNSLLSGRLESGKDDVVSSLVDSKFSESVMPMKHLIAAAQAKRRQAQLQNHSHVYSDSFLSTTTDLTGRSPNVVLPILPFPTGCTSTAQPDQYSSRPPLISPSSQAHLSSLSNQHVTEEFDERRISSVQRPAGGSLSGCTEAAVARDAFEGMIETLSRTKESIGRATRLAIDCAKYGIANEVVELLIRKLEIEPSFHRKVDLFFLVDSITQCSHSHKGIASSSYIPMVEASLPRLLGAAAPAGAAGRENRRQCLKVLRLWLERKILPEPLLRRYMDDIGASNDDSSAGIFLKRPSRSERSVDDPIREMEGMLVDEYGSNATFQLPGLPSRLFEEDEEEEDDIPSTSGGETGGATSPVEPSPVMGELDNCSVTPNDRRHHILEDVDGELEMEDVSGHPKDEKLPFGGGSFDCTSQQPVSNGNLEAALNALPKSLFLPEGSPPLPLDSPPSTPPLPSSPPPPSPPPLPPSSPSPPPPPPPPPPPLPSQPYPPPPPPLGIPQSLPIQPPLQPQPLMTSQQSHSLSSTIPSSSPKLGYPQPPIQHEYSSTPNVNQHVQLASDTNHTTHIDSTFRSEMLPHQSTSFVTGVCNSREPSGFNLSRPLEYGHGDMYSNQASLSNQQFQPGNTTFAQRPMHPALSTQNPSGHFSYPKPSVQQHPQHQQHQQHPYPPPYPMQNPPDVPRRYVADEHWRMPTNDFNTTDHQHGTWMSTGRTPSASGLAFGQEGYFRPHIDRPPNNNVGFQPPAPSMLPPGGPLPGHSLSQMMPCRPDLSAINCWRPA